MTANSRSALEGLLATMEGSKGPFLDKVASAIRVYIEGQGKDCVAVVERGGVYGDTTHRPNMDDPVDFCKVLYHFVRSKKYNNHTLDSALTEPVVDIVEEKYVQYFESHSEDISKVLMQMLVEDEVVLQSFLGMVTDQVAQTATKYGRQQVVHLVMSHLQDSLSQSSQHAVANKVTALTATATGQQVAMVVSHLLVKLLAVHLKCLVTKLLTSVAAKEIIFMLVKKYIAAAVLSAVVQFLATHLGMVGGASIMWVLIPIMMAFLARQIYVFPETLAEKVSESVRGELSGQFRQVNKTAIEKIFDEAFRGDKLVGAIVTDKDFVRAVDTLLKKV